MGESGDQVAEDKSKVCRTRWRPQDQPPLVPH